MKHIAKKAFMLLAATLFCVCMYSQDLFSSKKNSISFIVTPPKPFSGFLYDYKGSIDGGGSYDEKKYFNVGLEYLRNIYPNLYVGGGVTYSHYKINTSPAYSPGIDMSSTSHKLNILSVPVTVKYKFLKYFFVNGGGVFNFRLSKVKEGYFNYDDNKFGLHFGLGGEYTFRNNISVGVSPYFQINNLSGNRTMDFYSGGVRLFTGYNF